MQFQLIAVPLCLALESPNNGQLRKISGDNSVDLVVGSIAEFSCNSGYVVAGQERLVCKSFSNGVEWNGKPPTCKLCVYISKVLNTKANITCYCNMLIFDLQVNLELCSIATQPTVEPMS